MRRSSKERGFWDIQVAHKEALHRTLPGRAGRGLFLAESLKAPSITASFFPSSRFLTSALLRFVDFTKTRTIVELGIGTGAITLEILRRMSPGARLYGLDINPVFVAHVRSKVADSRFIPICGGAEQLRAHLTREGVRSADAVISSLGLTSMPHPTRSIIVEQIASHLRRDGILTQYQYIHASGEPNWSCALGLKRFAEEYFLREYFREVWSENVVLNLPPARVYTCRL